MSHTTEPSFEALLKRIEEIAGTLERGEMGLEASLALFEEGMKLSKQGTSRLDLAEKKLEVLLQNGDTEPLVPMGS